MKKQTLRKFIRKKKTKDNVVSDQKAEPKKFPSISRSIPDRSRTQFFYILAVCVVSGAILLGILVMEHELLFSYSQLQTLKAERRNIESQVRHWQVLSGKYPDDKDIYLHVALLEYELGNKDLAQEYADRSLKIDPNFEKAQTFAGSLK